MISYKHISHISQLFNTECAPQDCDAYYDYSLESLEILCVMSEDGHVEYDIVVEGGLYSVIAGFKTVNKANEAFECIKDTEILFI